jgi:hypothetical protein
MNIEKFNNTLIAFDFENETVNATDLLKSYNNNRVIGQKEKKMGDFLRLKATKEYTEYLKSKTGIPVLSTIQGIQGGTFMSRKLAYDFAAWLSIDFKDFIYNVFESFLQKKLTDQQRQLDYFWDKQDIKDLYN